MARRSRLAAFGRTAIWRYTGGVPKAVETVVFNGVKFRRFGDAWCFVPSGTDRKRGVGNLHQEIWKAAHGPIPPGHQIHHRDHNPFNNDLANLVCLSREEHTAHHKADPKRPTPAQRAAWTDSAPLRQARAAEWHRSPEGRAWHQEHGRSAWADRTPVSRDCDQCGTPFESITRRPDDRFCSNACKSAWRRANGVDDEQRVCAGCGAPFAANRYSKARCCSRKCAWVLRRRAS